MAAFTVLRFVPKALTCEPCSEAGWVGLGWGQGVRGVKRLRAEPNNKLEDFVIVMPHIPTLKMS
jgi:hypothetical protein